MDIPLLLIIFTIPALLYLAVHRRRGGAWSEGLVNIGWQWPQPVYWLWGCGAFTVFTVGCGPGKGPTSVIRSWAAW